MARIPYRADKPLISGKNLFEHARRGLLKKTIHLPKQVEQVKTAGVAQQNAVEACDPASFGPMPQVK